MDNLVTPVALRRSGPLAAPGPSVFVDVEIRERRDAAKLRLRTAPRSMHAFATLLGAALGIAPPLAPNRVAGDQGLSLAWTAPGAWLALGEKGACDALADFAVALAPDAAMLVTPVSSGLCTLEVVGARAAELLETECPLDLSGGAVGEGGCASSLFGQTPVFLQRLAGLESFTVVVERPLAWSLWAALADNARLLPRAAPR